MNGLDVYFLDFPDWVRRLSLALDDVSFWPGGFFILLTLANICLISIVICKRTLTPFYKAIICIALLELPIIIILLLWIAGLPKA
jgi:hypothetical protein